MKNYAFPGVSGKNLKRKKYNFPQDFPEKFSIVLLAFYRYQQEHIDTWLPFVTQLESTFQDLAYVEIPVIYQMGLVRQFILNEGMRAGIPDDKARERTVTLYLDKPWFFKQLGIDSQEEIQILLVEDGGEILWYTSGIYSEEKGTALNKILLGVTGLNPDWVDDKNTVGQQGKLK